MARTKNIFRVSPEVLGPLGAEQLQDPALAVLELVKNSWDADAEKVAIRINVAAEDGYISVADTGHGMDLEDFSSRWLVIGGSFKRTTRVSPNGRPLIGEKGLGRLATFALGSQLIVSSRKSKRTGFSATVDWKQLMASESLDQYNVDVVETSTQKIGTTLRIERLGVNWTREHSDFLLDHLRFLTEVPETNFTVTLEDPWAEVEVASPASSLKRLSEAHIYVEVSEKGEPRVTSCSIDGVDRAGIVFRPLGANRWSKALGGIKISLDFFRRGEAARKLDNILSRNHAHSLLDAYQGVRIYVDGINVPPYGLRGDDWAQLEKLRTATGGPTLTPGNSQLVGAVHLTKRSQTRFVVTAGRSGFSDQQAVQTLAEYVQWAVKSLATARRAAHLDITRGEVPPRVKLSADTDEKRGITPAALRRDLERAAKSNAVVAQAEIQATLNHAVDLVDAFQQNQETLRLYAQLASTGIAATSFAHELRTDFDIMSSSIRELRANQVVDAELAKLLSASWSSIQSFASLFRLMPVKIRRQSRIVSDEDLLSAARQVTLLAEKQGVVATVEAVSLKARLVPAEVDSILLNLVSNALKAVKESHQRDTGRILVRFERNSDSLVVRVADNGCGVSEAIKKVMFLPLEGGFSEGTGMGLPIVQFIASQYGGALELVDSPARDYVTELRVTLSGVIK